MIEITGLSESNVEEVAFVEKACFSTPWSKEAFLKDIKNPDAVYFCLEEDCRVLGYIGMWNILGEGNITNIAVLPEQRGKGYGKKLLCEMLRYGKTHGLSFLTLEVRASNEIAINLYQSCGFLEVGRRKRYYEGKEDAILMTYDFT